MRVIPKPANPGKTCRKIAPESSFPLTERLNSLPSVEWASGDSLMSTWRSTGSDKPVGSQLAGRKQRRHTVEP